MTLTLTRPDSHTRLALVRPDAELTEDALAALRNRSDIPPGIDATARHGIVILTGSVAWEYQKTAAERAVQRVQGVRGINNHLEVSTAVSLRDVQHRVVAALHHVADMEARGIEVEVIGRTVTLSGRVLTWVEKNEAERAAWRSPGVSGVRNHLDIVP